MSWNASVDPDGDSVKYYVTYRYSNILNDIDNATLMTLVSNTSALSATYTVPNTHGGYYYKFYVQAHDGEVYGSQVASSVIQVIGAGGSINIDGSFKPSTDVLVKIDGVWRQNSDIHCNVNGIWCRVQ